ncbi:unnamed protein product [Effrenium voratum]|nr:unnamed protein product [Effrenium voratum]
MIAWGKNWDEGQRGAGPKGWGKEDAGQRSQSKGGKDGRGGKGDGDWHALVASLAGQLEPGQPKTVPLYPAGEGVAVRAPTFQELPAWAAAGAVREALRRSQVVCIQGETGCGKSSVMPMVFLEDPKCKIAVTQPRRIAAISLAQRWWPSLQKRSSCAHVGCCIGCVSWESPGQTAYRVAKKSSGRRVSL